MPHRRLWEAVQRLARRRKARFLAVWKDIGAGIEAMKRSPIAKAGKKTREWNTAWRELKPKLERAGVTRCEFRYEGCWQRNGLTPAHSRKRRNITTPDQLREVAICCIVCHAKLELLPEAEMTKAVQQAIAARPDWN